MGARRIVIGDVHGHYDGLMQLFDVIAPSAEDQVYFLGDLIDRGPKSAEVLDFVRGHRYLSLLGNHEQLLLNAFPNGKLSNPALQGWLYSGGQATLLSYKEVNKLLDHLSWIATFPTSLDLGNVWLAHAGVHPSLSLEEQTAQELCWIREEFHSITTPYFADKLIIIGHTITFTLPGVAPGELAQGQGWLGIDTGAYHPKSGWLTGIDIDQWTVYQVNIFHRQHRVLPLAEISTRVEPNQILSRHHALRS